MIIKSWDPWFKGEHSRIVLSFIISLSKDSPEPEIMQYLIICWLELSSTWNNVFDQSTLWRTEEKNPPMPHFYDGTFLTLNMSHRILLSKHEPKVIKAGGLFKFRVLIIAKKRHYVLIKSPFSASLGREFRFNRFKIRGNNTKANYLVKRYCPLWLFLKNRILMTN